ncbi:hypothetical protein M5K25_000628 [Dendrobium thyrsiflorum]|uniref:Uncharacterized protein n=1 Tax=Dendrobium thyrsiflorum TaxID=117978 RepID=A0ABD0VWE4_DENTH
MWHHITAKSPIRGHCLACKSILLLANELHVRSLLPIVYKTIYLVTCPFYRQAIMCTASSPMLLVVREVWDLANLREAGRTGIGPDWGYMCGSVGQRRAGSQDWVQQPAVVREEESSIGGRRDGIMTSRSDGLFGGLRARLGSDARHSEKVRIVDRLIVDMGFEQDFREKTRMAQNIQ